jgi:hypothetical protein
MLPNPSHCNFFGVLNVPLLAQEMSPNRWMLAHELMQHPFKGFMPSSATLLGPRSNIPCCLNAAGDLENLSTSAASICYKPQIELRPQPSSCKIQASGALLQLPFHRSYHKMSKHHGRKSMHALPQRTLMIRCCCRRRRRRRRRRLCSSTISLRCAFACKVYCAFGA